MRYNKLVPLLIVLLIAVAISFSAGYFLHKMPDPAVPVSAASSADPQTNDQAATQSAKSEKSPEGMGIFSMQTGTSEPVWSVTAMEIIIRLFLAVLLSAAIAFRPRRNVPFFQRNLYVAQTEILLAVVAAALMMIVGDNTGRAFAIFAAASLVRFRTNIRDPKETTVLLISLALGLAAGVGRWELGLSLCLFSVALLWVLEYKEHEKLFRSMELTVRTKAPDKTQATLKRIFEKYKVEAEVRQIEPPVEDEPIGSIMYYLNLQLSIGTDRMSDQILKLDADNIEGIEWKQKKAIANT